MVLGQGLGQYTGQLGEVLVAIVVNQVHQDHNQEGQAVLTHLLSPGLDIMATVSITLI